MVSELPDQGGEVIQFRKRTPPEPFEELELSDHQLATRDGHDVTKTDEPVDAEIVEEVVGPVRRMVRPAVRRVKVASRRVRQHEPTVRTSKAAARNLMYVLAGTAVLAKRMYDRRHKYDRYEMSAEIARDEERLRYWEERGEKARENKHKRRMERAELQWRQIKRTALIYVPVAALVLALLGFAAAASTGDWSWLFAPLKGTVKAIGWLVVTVIAFLWLLGLLLVTAGVSKLWWVGRRYGEIPRWAAAPATRDNRDDVPITPSIVVTAFRDLGLSELRKAIVKMGDAGAAMLGPITIAGCGVEVDVALPSGTSTHEIQKRRHKLAGNLYRHEHEVFITIPPAARTVRLWIADPGALDEPIGPSPLVMDEDMTADLFTGQAPWGQDLRGDRAALSLLMRHLLITGLSNQGKTAALRALVLWLVLDPTVELRIADLKGVGDWRMFSQLATTLIQGPTDEHVIAATEMLEEGVREMETRIAALEASGATDGVTRQMARSGQGFHPLFLLVDEAQVAFMCPAKDAAGALYGGTKATSRYFMAARKLHNQGRAVLVHLWQGTQDPTDQNLPKLVREGAHIRAALVLGTEQQSRMALGDKAVNGGAAPHKLRQGLDKGTLVVAGDGAPLPDGQASITIRTHFINGETAVELAERAVERRGPARAAAAEIGPAARDLLADVGEVLAGKTEAVRAADVPRLLAATFPTHKPYRDMKGTELAARLTAEGAKVPTTGNVYPVYPERVREALRSRDA